jgi:hypothetical protein
VPALARNRPSASVSPKHVRLQNGSRRAIRSPRSSMERKKAVDRARGALHNANTGTRAVYPRPGTPPRASTPACTARPGPSGTGCAPGAGRPGRYGPDRRLPGFGYQRSVGMRSVRTVLHQAIAGGEVTASLRTLAA